MADELFSAGGQIGADAAKTSVDQNLREKELRQKSGDAASGELGADRRQMSAQQAQMGLEKLKDEENYVEFTPQIALGMVNATGNKEWLRMSDNGPDGKPHRMRADMLLGWLTAESKQKWAPKMVTRYVDGKQQNGLIWMDPDGNKQEFWPGEGIDPGKLHPGKGGKGGSGGDDTFKKNKEFLAQYNKRRAEYSDPIKAKEIQQTNPDKYSEDQQWLKENMDQYDKLTRGMGKAGAQAPKPAAGTSGDSGGGQAFDADAFIKEALGSGQ